MAEARSVRGKEQADRMWQELQTPAAAGQRFSETGVRRTMRRTWRHLDWTFRISDRTWLLPFCIPQGVLIAVQDVA